MRNLLLSALLTVAVLPVSAKITFENQTISAKADPTASKEIAIFKFANTGDKPVTIKDVKTSCGCTTTKLDKFVYEPGEAGEITATLDLGGRIGQQTKQITVTTDDPEQQQVVVQFVVDIPELVSFSSRGLVWAVGAEPLPQTIKVKVTHSEPINIKEVKSNDAAFAIELKTIEEGKEYEIIVTPASTTERTIRSGTVITDFPPMNPKMFTLSLRVY